MKKVYLLLAVFFSCLSFAVGQKSITGNVKDANGEALIGVNVFIKGMESRGTLTDIDGNYVISAREGETLVYSYIGFGAQEFVVGSTNNIDVTLAPDAELIDEVVVIGYGQVRKSDLTGSVSSVSGDELRTTLTTNLDQALQGRVAGVQVTQNSGAPGGAASIRIRGANSLALSNEPLYVIDGIQFQGDGGSTAGFDWAGGANGQNRVNPLSTINPADIVSIDVLKDASATAIYGSRGANGVIIITTKRGKAGRSKISYNSYYGLQELQRKLDMMPLNQFAEYQAQIANDLERQINQRYADASLLGAGTDWQDEIFRKAGSMSHQLSVSGGNDKTTYAVTGGYYKQDGIVIGSNFDRISTRINVDNTVTDWLKFGGNFAFTKTNETITLNDGGDGVIMQSLMMNPDVSVRDIDGNYAGPNSNELSAGYNPVAAALERNNTLARQRLLSNVYGNFNIFKGLEFRSEFGFDNNHSLNHAFQPTYKWGAIENRENRLRQREENSFFWINKNYFTYNTKIAGDHSVNVLLGHEAQKSNYSGTDLTVRNLPSNDIQILSQGTPVGNPGAWKGAQSLLSYYTRVNYGFRDKFLATFTYRADASSKFGPGNKWGYFPSGAIAYRLSEEAFLKDNDMIDNLKIRLGYGVSGNQSIENGAFGALMRSVQTPFGLGFRPSRIANPNLGWESTAQLNAGVDVALFNNRIDFTVDVYNKQTSDMLLTPSVPSYLGGAGYNNIEPPIINVGRLENKGFDLSINSRNIIKDKFTWTTGLTFSRNRNKVLELDDDARIYWQNLYWYSEFQTATTTRVGQPIGMFWGFVTDGLFANEAEIRSHAVQVSDGVLTSEHPNGQNLVDKRTGVWIGDIRFKDLNGDGVINQDDQTYIGNPNPDFTFGVNNSLSYGPFEATIYLNGSVGGDILNYSRVITEGMTNVFSNQAASVFNRAQYKYLDPNGSPSDPANVVLANPGTDIPRPTTNDVNRNTRMSDRFIEDGTYLRLQNLQMGYTLPQSLTRKARVERLKVYFNAQNLFLLTNYKGYDPEIGAFNQSARLQNADMGRYPTPRMYTIGFDVDF
ncbi:MAG: TonB-dependent receptor [Saprospiraceae bacterium]|nr:TonB-dependent receptor [Saprospiraceae bacterium]